MLSISGQMKTSRASLDIKNLTNTQKMSLRNDWKTITETYSKCNADTRRIIVESRKNIIDVDIDKWNTEVESMKGKGLDTAEMELVIADGSQLSGMLDDALKLTSDSEFKTKIDEINDLHLHIWARYHIARLNSYIVKIEATPGSTEYADELNSIKALLNEAENLATPGRKYGNGEFTTTWNNIKQAQNELKGIVDDWKTKAAEQNNG
jgi:hypothetical protein